MDYCRHHITSSTQTILLYDRSYLSHSESEQYKLRDSKFRARLGQVEVCVWSTTKLEKGKINPVQSKNRTWLQAKWLTKIFWNLAQIALNFWSFQAIIFLLWTKADHSWINLSQLVLIWMQQFKIWSGACRCYVPFPLLLSCHTESLQGVH